MTLEDGTNIKLFKGTEVQLLGYQDVPMFGWHLAIVEYNGTKGSIDPYAIEEI